MRQQPVGAQFLLSPDDLLIFARFRSPPPPQQFINVCRLRICRMDDAQDWEIQSDQLDIRRTAFHRRRCDI